MMSIKQDVAVTRRSSETMLVDAWADITTPKRHVSWRSEVTKGNIEDSLNNRICIVNNTWNYFERKFTYKCTQFSFYQFYKKSKKKRLKLNYTI